MFSSSVIATLARQAAIEAIYYEKQPYNPQPGETSRWGERAPIPNLGDYRPDGWKLIDWIEIERMFTTGQDRACAWIEQVLAVDSTAGFAMIEEAQFTFVIGYFTKDPTIEPKCVDTHKVLAGQIEITTCPDCEEPLEVGAACENCGYDPDDEDEDEDDDVCEREWDGDGWQCLHDCTGCLWNDGNNTCSHEGDSLTPLDDDKE